MQPTLIDVINLAKGAGEIIRDGIGDQHRVQYKGDIDVVTEVDKRSETYLVEEIRCNYPGATFVTEEGTGQADGEKINSSVWYIDPLDGTTNFVHGMPIFSVSIAYAENGRLQLGVVYDPVRGDLFAAERGQGATLNGQPIHVSHVSELINSMLGTGFPYDLRTNPDNNLAEFARFSGLTQAVRRMGSAALDMCYVAAGWFDGFWELRIETWDIAAGAIIVEEAGGVVTKVDGDPSYLSEPMSVLASNPHLHPKMLDVLRSLRSKNNLKKR